MLCGIMLIITSIDVNAQHYFVVGKDTTFCNYLVYGTTAQGFLNSLEYTDTTGKNIILEGRDNVPDVATFFINGFSIDKTPVRAHKPNGYIRYTERAVDGKLRVYLARQSYTPAMGSLEAGGPSGIYRFYLKMPDGTYYKINNKHNMEDFIKPYLLKCKDFENQYKGDFSAHEGPFMKMIRLYNSLCE